MLRYLTCTITMYVMVVALARSLPFVMRILTCIYVLQLGGRPHFYLALIGVIPEAQGMGYGAELMREAPEHRLPAATRKAMLVRFAQAAAHRLHGLVDPESATISFV